MSWFKKNTIKLSGGEQAVSAKTLLVSDYLSEKSVHFFSPGTSKKEILFKLVSLLSVFDHGMALNAVLERENRGGTIIDSEISIPHARVKGLKTIELAIGLCEEPQKNQPRLFFLFLSPQEDAKIHLLFLSSLSSLFQTEIFVEELSRLKAPHEVVQKIRQMEKGL